MELNDKTLSFIGLVVTWIAGVFGVGIAWGKTSKRIDQIEESIKRVETTTEESIKRVVTNTEENIRKIEMAISRIDGYFFTPGNEPRLISYEAHDRMQQTCQRRIDERQAAVDRRMDERQEVMNRRLTAHDKKLDDILQAIADLKARGQ